MVFGFISAFLILLVDLLTKHFLYGMPAHSVIGNVLWIESRLNDGIAFSFFEGQSYVFAIIGIVACVAMVWLILSKSMFGTKLAKIGLGLVLGGTLGNVFDRFMLGGVRDFIYLKFINYPIFNIADVGIVVGVILICIYVIFSGIKKGKQASNTDSKNENQGSGKQDD